jgi:hypothetical protein
MMSPRASGVALCVVIALITGRHASAAVRILEGVPASQPVPPASTDGSSSSPGAATAPAAPSAPGPVLMPPGASAPPSLITPAEPKSAASPPAPGTPNELLPTKIDNPAQLSIEMLPGQTVSIGSRVFFRVTSKQAGYLVIVDVDVAGKVTQLYPNTLSLLRSSRANANFIKAGGTAMIPLPNDPYAGVEYVISPPAGPAMVIAILSERPVQLVDIPDVPSEIRGQPAAISYVAKRISELRVPDPEGGQLLDAKWSLDARPYQIQ